MAVSLWRFCTAPFSLCLSVRSAPAPSVLPEEKHQKKKNTWTNTEEHHLKKIKNHKNINKTPFFVVCVCGILLWEVAQTQTYTPQLRYPQTTFFLKQQFGFDMFYRIFLFPPAVSLNIRRPVWNGVRVNAVTGWSHADRLSVCIIHTADFSLQPWLCSGTKAAAGRPPGECNLSDRLRFSRFWHK